MSQQGIIHRMESLMGSVAAWNHRKPVIALAIAAILSAVLFLGAKSLTLNADLVELLPSSFDSVKDLDKLRQRFGGMGYVVVAGLDAEPDQLKAFADDLAPKLAELPEARFVDYKRSTDFFEDRALFYIEPGDLKAIKKRISDRIKFERRQRNPMFIQLDEETPPSIDFADIEEKYTGSASNRLAGSGDLYYIDPEAKMIVLLMKPQRDSADLKYAKKVTGDVSEYLKTQDFSKYGPNFRWEITGNYKKKVDQQQEITRDLGTASVVALVVLLLYLVFHFRSAIAVTFTMIPVSAALLWTYGYVGFWYGQVNLLTGFLGAILGGLGTEHGIHLYGRYTALRDEGKTSEEAIREAFSHTGFSALISSLVAALTFLSLAISEFRAFREFGVIAAIGMLLAIAAYTLIFPSLIGIVSRLGWKPKARGSYGRMTLAVASIFPRLYRPIAIAAAVVVALLVFMSPGVRFNFDFSALDDVTLPSVQLDKKIDKILGYSQTPVVVLTENPEMEREVTEKLVARKQQGGETSTIDFVAAISDLVPQNQEEKKVVIDEIGALVEKIDPSTLDKDARAGVERAQRLTKALPFAREDLPKSVRRQFEGTGGDNRGFVLVFARVSLSDGANVQRFSQEVRRIDLASGERISAAGEAMILADILDMVRREAPEVLIAAILSVLVAMWISMGALKEALLCLTPTIVSVLSLAGLMSIFDLPFNYLNIIVVPVLIGTTVDAGVHLVSRLRETAKSEFVPVYAETGRAIAGGLLTSAVGFGALALAHHPGLNSVGNIANLGFATNFVIVLFGFPALLLVVQSRKEKAEAKANPPKQAA